MLVYAATKNPGKLRELCEIFARSGWEIAASPRYADVVEGRDSYAGNAALKARALHERLIAAGERVPVVGDDSGLEVAAMGGRPGVLSARYGGADASWTERRRLLLAELAATGSNDRRARFVCALHYVGADGREVAVMASYVGDIAESERGDGGFSYDAIFVGSDGRTFAELSEAEKSRTSHRARAGDVLIAALALPGPNQRRPEETP